MYDIRLFHTKRGLNSHVLVPNRVLLKHKIVFEATATKKNCLSAAGR